VKRPRTVTSATVAAALSLAGAATGLAAATGSGRSTIHRVDPGQSIQAAIDAAEPGDTIVVAPGVYRETLAIQKDDITLRGTGSGAGGTVLELPAQPNASPCTEEGTVNGICVAGEFVLGSDAVGRPVHGVRVSGFRVRGFTRFGVVVYNAVDTTVAETDVAGSGLWGFAAFAVKTVRFVGDASHDNRQGGFYVGDAPRANALLEDDAAYGNATSEGIGIFLRDSSRGIVRGNRLEANCSGLIAVDTAGGGPVDGWRIEGNTVRGNSAACAPSEDIPLPLSGLGIAALGTSDTAVRDNRVEDNSPGADAPLTGGILVASSESLGGVDPERVTVRDNVATGNAPADLLYDGSGEGVRIERNGCATSLPSGLCG